MNATLRSNNHQMIGEVLTLFSDHAREVRLPLALRGTHLLPPRDLVQALHTRVVVLPQTRAATRGSDSARAVSQQVWCVFPHVPPRCAPRHLLSHPKNIDSPDC